MAAACGVPAAQRRRTRRAQHPVADVVAGGGGGGQRRGQAAGLRGRAGVGRGRSCGWRRRALPPKLPCPHITATGTAHRPPCATLHLHPAPPPCTTAHLDDGGAALLHRGNEVAVQVGVVADDLWGRGRISWGRRHGEMIVAAEMVAGHGAALAPGRQAGQQARSRDRAAAAAQPAATQGARRRRGHARTSRAGLPSMVAWLTSGYCRWEHTGGKIGRWVGRRQGRQGRAPSGRDAPSHHNHAAACAAGRHRRRRPHRAHLGWPTTWLHQTSTHPN